jgi:alkyldihydroxyacetonephosphate synthase
MNYEKMDMSKVVDAYEDVEHMSREAVIKYGGSISHHHGVGKLRKRFMEKSYTEVNSEIYRGVKQ